VFRWTECGGGWCGEIETKTHSQFLTSVRIVPFRVSRSAAAGPPTVRVKWNRTKDADFAAMLSSSTLYRR
jgi:hypothetical protein